MLVVPRCCCCVHLKDGAMIIGIMYLFFYTAMGWFPWTYPNCFPDEEYKTIQISYVHSPVQAVTALLAIIFLVGICMDWEWSAWMFLVWMAILFIYSIAIVVMTCIYLDEEVEMCPKKWLIGLLMSIMTLGQAYWILCVFSYIIEKL